MRTAHNYFVVALAFSDLFLCLFSMPITLWELVPISRVSVSAEKAFGQVLSVTQGNPKIS
jgi:hypothetical protein